MTTMAPCLTGADMGSNILGTVSSHTMVNHPCPTQIQAQYMPLNHAWIRYKQHEEEIIW